MPSNGRRLAAIVAGVLILAAVNYTLVLREKHLASGRVVFLELAPVDPRSLMQGDYMALRFQAEADAFPGGHDDRGENGRLIVQLDARDVGRFVRRDDGTPLAADEVALRYRVRDGRVKFATNAFFFQEGDGPLYEAARYGEFRVAPSGELLLTALRGQDLEPLGPR